MRRLMVLLPWLVACGPNSVRMGLDGLECTDGEQRCSEDREQTCISGFWQTVETCEFGCVNGVGCAVCTPNSASCEGNTSLVCRSDGTGFDEYLCDPVMGLGCDPDAGVCIGECSPLELGQSYIGCEYYPTVTGNIVGNEHDFAVVIANTSDEPAHVTIDEGALASPLAFTVPAHSVHVQTLPWVESLKLCNSDFSCWPIQSLGGLVAKGAYHLRSDRPITAYQFNPLDYYQSSTGTSSYTNDASLLIPTNAWSGNYIAAGYYRLDFGSDYTPSFVAVTASQDNTQVTITTPFNTPAANGAPAFTAGVPQTVTLQRGSVLEITASYAAFSPLEDLTGTRIEASKRVQVISGHVCAYVPSNVAACDHLEESMFPLESLSNRYLITAPAVPPLPNGKQQVVRIIATQPDTELTFEPPQPVPTTIANAGQFVEIVGPAVDYKVTANHKILVAQYMQGEDAGGDTGDPAMALAVALDQYRTDYLFHAPTNYEVNYVNVTAPLGKEVLLDGVAVTGFSAIGDTGYGVARVQIPHNADGNHVATSEEPFGISVYGYGQYTSYWYPGGLNLVDIPIE